jgi:hypothetical protein
MTGTQQLETQLRASHPLQVLGFPLEKIMLALITVTVVSTKANTDTAYTTIHHTLPNAVYILIHLTFTAAI